MVEIKEKITFSDFDSQKLGLWLMERDAPRPNVKDVIVQSIPFRDGGYDFTDVPGFHSYALRTITYQFYAFNMGYEERKKLEKEIKRSLSYDYQGKLVDSHDRGGHWWGRCSSVKVEDEHERQRLKVEISFLCDPYFIRPVDANTCFFWDEFWFPDLYEQKYRYSVEGFLRFQFANNGQTPIIPTIFTDSRIGITLNGESFELETGKNFDYNISLPPGMSEVSLSGFGTVEFQVDEREMI